MALEGLKNPARRLLRLWRRIPLRNGNAAFGMLMLAVFMCGVESAHVQVSTAYRAFSWSLFSRVDFLLLLALDFLVPLIVALLSRRAFFLFLAGQCFLSVILLHYTIFFYNPLTLSTIYHSVQGAASLGFDIFGFARLDVIVIMGAIFALKVLLVQLSNLPNRRMPRFWQLRGLTAIGCMFVVALISVSIYGRTGMSLLWVDSRGHRTATERRLEEGTGQAVRSIGYLATWIGEWMSGTYKDTALIYAEARCADPDTGLVTSLIPSQGSGAAAQGRDCARWSGNCRGDMTLAQEPEALGTGELNLSGPGPAPGGPEADVFLSRAGMDGQASGAARWNGLPVPPKGRTLALIQAESLDFAALGMRVNGRAVLPFLEDLAKNSLLLKVFAPHKVGSCNSDYELLNGRVANQNVIYYSYIKEYPDSVIRLLAEKGYEPSVFHGLNGGLFNLREAYTAQGFKHFAFKEEMLARGYPESSYIMEHVLDEHVFALAAGQLAPAKPQAQFIVTMSSHIPFIDPLPGFKSAGGRFARYVSSLHYLDSCLAGYYAQLPPGSVLVIWGDHGSDVDYPRGFVPNERHVPFMVHVKGENGWLESWRREQDGTGRPAEAAGGPGLGSLRERLEEPGAEGFLDNLRPSDGRIYNLCELAYYLRALAR